MPVKKYSDKQKLAYYKKKASQASSHRPKIRGRGDYKIKPPKARGYNGYGAYIGAGLGSAVGSMIAPGIGTAVGAPLGSAIGYAADKIFGWGDYQIKQNSLLHKSGAVFEGPDNVRVRHREFICNIASTSTFTNQSFPLNPGLRTSFPWLSAIAENFEQYKWNGLIAEFVSTSADALNSTNTALGTLMMATDYDPADSNFTSKQQMLGNFFSNSGKPSCNMMHAIECAPASMPMEWYYVRANSVPSGKDNRLYDLANFQIATEGSQAAAIIGELWFTYDVTFAKRQMNNTLGLALASDHFQFSTGVTTSAYFGTATNTAVSGSNLGSSIATSTFLFPSNLGAGTYLFTYNLLGASTLCSSLTFTPSNCEFLSVYRGDTLSSLSTNGVTTTSYFSNFVVKITAQGAGFLISGGTIPATITAGDLFVVQLNGNIST
nr:MAG: putative capsid protein [Arizlama virus]